MERRKKKIHKNQRKKDIKANRENKNEVDDGKIEIVPEKRMEDYDVDSLAETLAMAKKMLRNRPREEII